MSIELFDRRLLIVTGKGGVGKSTISAALALLAADHGRRVLLVDVDAKADLAAMFEHAPVGYSPVAVHPGISMLAMQTEASLREYLKLHLRIPLVARLGPLAKTFDFVANAAPGVKEILTIGKIGWEVREAIDGRAPWDLVVVNASASGHVIAQLGAPQAIRELVQVGPVRQQTDWLRELLADPTITAASIVVTPEEMPVVETIELVAEWREQLDVPLGPIFVNRVLPELLARTDEATFAALSSPEGRGVLIDHLGEGIEPVLDGARLAVALRRSRTQHLTRLRDAVDLPMVHLPYLFVRGGGMRIVRMMADALYDEMAQ